MWRSAVTQPDPEYVWMVAEARVNRHAPAWRLVMSLLKSRSDLWMVEDFDAAHGKE